MSSWQERYPFITFKFRCTELPEWTWFALGEAMSKCQHLAGIPLKPAVAVQMSSIYLARGVQATTAIEGNTLSEDEVKDIVNKGTANVSESRQYLEREAQNILAAIGEIDEAIQRREHLPIDVDRLCDLNFKILDGIPDKPEVIPGKLRQHDVRAGSYRPPAWPDVPELTEQLVKWLASLRDEARQQDRAETRFLYSVLAAILAHLYIAWVHPFGNGNGRLARLVEVQILSESGVVPLVATNLLSDHYNKTRNNYYLALDAAQRDVGAFVSYALKGFVDELREQIAEVRRHNIQVMWESFIFEKFREQPSTTARDRQRDVVLHMDPSRTYTPEQITELNSRLIRLYGQNGERTPARDMNELVKMGLVERVGRREYRALRRIIQAFIPPIAT